MDPYLDRFDSAANGWIFPSSVTESEYPAIEIGIGAKGNERLFSIYPGDLAFSKAERGYFWCSGSSLTSRWIYGGIQDRGSQDFDILGDIFLKNVYAVGSLALDTDCRSGMSNAGGLGPFNVLMMVPGSTRRWSYLGVKCPFENSILEVLRIKKDIS